MRTLEEAIAARSPQSQARIRALAEDGVAAVARQIAREARSPLPKTVVRETEESQPEPCRIKAPENKQA
ncbi:hypothetical protein [Salmonella enterica]|uniref:Uncharacterized protein n=1 Tax=Salmonella enterica subsp. enterica serovar Karamoja TaxID=2500153 RepID=A0A3T0CIJ9_SALET|nr:hypothetical protein [Salmonella enterica]AZT44442.1 hypothetical protein EL007_24630 [Salmonella enterica subsp. enterica serovar Karamoja]